MRHGGTMRKLSDFEAEKFIMDVVSGTDDEVLMQRYAFSERSLELHKKLAINLVKKRRTKAQPPITVNVKSFLKDLKHGLNEREICSRHSLTARQLQRVYRKLIAGGFVTAREMASRLKITESQIFEVFAEAGALVKKEA